jgi:alpha-L-arabinofuranosidase
MKLHLCDALVALAAFGIFGGTAAPGGDVTIKIAAKQVIAEREQSLIGANIEDLNFQLYGGLYSQLLHGECFEEHVDPTELLSLTGSQRFAVWVVPDENGQPVLRCFNGRNTRLYETEGPVDWRSSEDRGKELMTGMDLPFRGGVILPKELPGDLGRQLVALATGDAQVSRHWRKVQAGSAVGALTLVRQGVFSGKQAQQIKFISGNGELGINNAGLFREGIPLVAGQPYEAVLRIKSDTSQHAFVSLRNASGKILAEKPLDLRASPTEYQRVTSDLVPSDSDSRGCFALTLRKPGTIAVDYAFLQAGQWGRYHGLPVRREMAEAIVSMGVKTMRYNGSMVNKCPDGATYYKWKKMIGPRDQRPPYHGFFNPYASHGFSVFDFMDFCQSAGIQPVIGLRTDETEQDMADLIDYCVGGPETVWGKRRIAEGHPTPYFLKAIEIGNEERPNAEYLARVKALAAAIWSKNRQLDVVVSVNVRAIGEGKARGKVGQADEALETFRELARWVRSQGQETRLVLDSHYQSTLDHADTLLKSAVGLTVHDAISRELPGFSLRLWPMEENGSKCNWERGLAHAHNLNTMNRMPACLERAGTANTFQAWNLNVVWDQGRIHFTPAQVFFQPSYYVDRMFADEWLPLVLGAECESTTVDVLAKKSRDGKVLTLYLANLAPLPQTTTIQLDGFLPARAEVVRIHSSELSERNAPEEPKRIAPTRVDWTFDPVNPRIDLPAYSFSMIRLSQ